MRPNKLQDRPLFTKILKLIIRIDFIIFVSVLTLSLAAYLYNTSFQGDNAAPNNQKENSRGGDRGGRRFRDDDTPSVVSVETSSEGDLPIFLNGLGTVTALRTVTVKPRVDGELIKVLFKEGQVVKEGDLLAEIDPRPFQIQLQQAEGQLLRDQALLKNAEIDHNRYQTLLAQDSIAAQQTATQQTLVKQYQGTVEMDLALVNNAKLQLSYAHLTAPISGRVGLRQIDQGNMVHANDPNGLVIITQLQPINVVFTLPEDKVQSVAEHFHQNEIIPVEAYDRSGRTILAKGKLIALDNQIDQSTGTLKLKAQFDNSNNTLFANQFVNIRMHLNTLSKVTLISSAALQNDAEGTFVFVVNQDQTVQQRRVSVGGIEGDKVAILANLNANELIVNEGVDRLINGKKVDIAQKDGVAVAANPDLSPKTDGKFRKRDNR